MLRSVVMVSLAALWAGACSEGGPATTLEPSASPPGTGTTVAQPGPTTSEVSAGTLPGEPAPDFTLALGEGGSFSLSREAKPVYLVFWAEW